MNPQLMLERSSNSFNVEEMTNWLDGGVENTRRRREITEAVQNDPDFSYDGDIYRSREQRMQSSIEKSVKMIHLAHSMGIQEPTEQVLSFPSSFFFFFFFFFCFHAFCVSVVAFPSYG